MTLGNMPNVNPNLISEKTQSWKFEILWDSNKSSNSILQKYRYSEHLMRLSKWTKEKANTAKTSNSQYSKCCWHPHSTSFRLSLVDCNHVRSKSSGVNPKTSKPSWLIRIECHLQGVMLDGVHVFITCDVVELAGLQVSITCDVVSKIHCHLQCCRNNVHHTIAFSNLQIGLSWITTCHSSLQVLYSGTGANLQHEKAHREEKPLNPFSTMRCQCHVGQ